MSTDPSGPIEKPTAPTVVAVVTAADADLLEPCLAAVVAQTQPPRRIFIVGGDDTVRRAASVHEVTWRPHLRGVYDAIGDDVTYVWFLRERSRPEPDALAALISDGERVEASVAGSKVIDIDNPERLVSVGYATDVFDAPYSGLEPGELDQEQHDVIRDVAAVADTSMLVRRDLFRGLRGVDLRMAPTAAAIDFCQRARLRGGRIVVVPSSVVAYQGPDPAPRWRERAGEIRAMIKAYSPLTLIWALPVSFLIGLVESLVRPFLGGFPLPGVIAAWGWNLIHLPSALGSRWQARRGREAGDEELFRFQTSGSARLRRLYEDVLERLGRRFPEGVLSGFSDAVLTGQQRVRHPAFFVGIVVIILALIGTRDIWTDHLPVVGFSLLPPESPVATLNAYAGGWNPAGFGSPEVLRPHVGAVALAQLLLFARGALAVSAITVLAFITGIFGTARMLRVWGIGSIPGYLAGCILMAGPATAAIAGGSHWAALSAMAAIPWAIAAAMRPWPQRTWRRISRIAGTTVAIGIGAAFAPLALFIPLLAIALWSVIGLGARLGALARVATATLLAVPLLIPWILYVDPVAFLTDGPAAFWTPGLVVTGLVAITLIGVLLSPDRALGSVGAWGGLLTATGALVARTGWLGAGRDVEIAGQLIVGLGVAVIAGAAFEMLTRRAGRMAAVTVVCAMTAIALLGSTMLVVGPGRAGLPRDTMTGTYGFAVPMAEPPNRILALGSDLPGTYRTLDGLPYRVFVPPFPTTWEAYLNEPRLGDEALHEFLGDVIDGRVRRAGNALADFGIGWVVFTERNALTQLFESQLDLVPLTSIRFPVMFNEIDTAPAFADGVVRWPGDGTAFHDPEEGGITRSVVVASNADFRWGGSTWEQDEWRNLVIEPGETVAFSGHQPRRLMAIGAGAWLFVLVVAVLVGRRETTP